MADETNTDWRARAQHTLTKLACVYALLFVVALVWELFASQAPMSLFHLPPLPGPVAQLRLTGLTGAMLFIFARSIADAWPGYPAKRLLLAKVGTALALTAQIYAAFRGQLAIQIVDPRIESMVVFGVRALGTLMLLGLLTELCLRALRRRP